jgi:VWFA-related protein
MHRRVTSFIWRVVVPAAGALALLCAPVGATQRESRERHVYVSVTTDNSTPVTGLTASDFVVRENDLAREILRVGPAPPPTHVALLLDDSASMEPALAELRRGMTAFAKAILAQTPKPELAITTFGERPTRQVPYTTAAEAVDRGIGRVFPRPNTGGYLLEAIVEETTELRKRKAERPVIVVMVNEDGPEFSNLTSERVQEALRAANASLWTISLQTQAPALTTEARERGEVLTDVSAASGGIYQMIVTRQGIEGALTRMANAIGARYDITYNRPEMLVPPDSLKVEVKRPSTRVWAPVWTGK